MTQIYCNKGGNMASPAQKRKRASKVSTVIVSVILGFFVVGFIVSFANDKNPVWMLLNKQRYEAGRARDNAMIYYEARNYEKAIPALEKLIEQEPDKAVYHGMLGISYARTGEPMKAISSLEKALELDPEMHSANGTLASIYLSYGIDSASKYDNDLAQDFYNKATKEIETALIKAPENKDYIDIQRMIIEKEKELDE